MIHNMNEAKVAIFSLVKKSFTYEGGALAIVATPLAAFIKKIFTLIFENVTEKDIVMPIVLFGVCLIAFTLVTIYDFFTGLSASKKEHIDEKGHSKGYIKSDKLWSSIWKTQGVIMIATLITLFSYVFRAIEMDTLAGFFVAGIPIFFIVVILFEIRSIGENHLRRYGKKPDHFQFLDDVAHAVKTGIIDKIGRLFK